MRLQFFSQREIALWWAAEGPISERTVDIGRPEPTTSSQKPVASKMRPTFQRLTQESISKAILSSVFYLLIIFCIIFCR